MLTLAPIGSTSNCFTGTLEGNGYKIIAPTIDQVNRFDTALFACLAGASIGNVMIEQPSVDWAATRSDRLGFLAGSALNTDIHNCTVNGGLLDLNNGDRGGSAVGALVGRFEGGSITGCGVLNTLVGSDNTNTVGILVGELLGSALLDGCYSANNEVWAFQLAGSMIGTCVASIVTRSFSSDTDLITVVQDKGAGFAGSSCSCTFGNDYSLSTVHGPNSVSTVAGFLGQAIAETQTGAGDCTETIINNCYRAGRLNATGLSGFFGQGDAVGGNCNTLFWDEQLDFSPSCPSSPPAATCDPYAIPLCTDAMQSPTTYTTANWPETTWLLLEGEYPSLQSVSFETQTFSSSPSRSESMSASPSQSQSSSPSQSQSMSASASPTPEPPAKDCELDGLEYTTIVLCSLFFGFFLTIVAGYHSAYLWDHYQNFSQNIQSQRTVRIFLAAFLISIVFVFASLSVDQGRADESQQKACINTAARATFFSVLSALTGVILGYIGNEIRKHFKAQRARRRAVGQTPLQ